MKMARVGCQWRWRLNIELKTLYSELAESLAKRIPVIFKAKKTKKVGFSVITKSCVMPREIVQQVECMLWSTGNHGSIPRTQVPEHYQNEP